ncbi:MAG: sigma-70 family RNA polymerase sigma factor [Clostridia bacterium]|nr:sigma-70 family RNA polymerase sigma factor [Clostridia bacterium]
MNDKKLLQLLKKDPNAGMDRLISQYSGLVFGIARGIMRESCTSDEIEDCVSEVFIKLSTALVSFEPRASLKTYIGVAARNTALDFVRNRIVPQSLDAEDSFIELPDGGDFEDELEKKELFAAVLREIEALGEPDSQILFRKYYLEQSSKHIAERMNLSVSSVDTRAHRALAKLRTKFGGNK